jgi:NADH-quinone oxidoreductase subunit L
MNRIGDLGFLIGIFILGYLFSTLNFVQLKKSYLLQILNPSGYKLPIAALCLFIGATGKSAQIPLIHLVA